MLTFSATKLSSDFKWNVADERNTTYLNFAMTENKRILFVIENYGGTICHQNCDTWTSALDNSETC